MKIQLLSFVTALKNFSLKNDKDHVKQIGNINYNAAVQGIIYLRLACIWPFPKMIANDIWLIHDC